MLSKYTDLYQDKLLSSFGKKYASHPEVFRKKGVIRNVAKFTGKHLCQSLFFNIDVSLQLY